MITAGIRLPNRQHGDKRKDGKKGMKLLKWLVGAAAAAAALVIVLPALAGRKELAEWHPQV